MYDIGPARFYAQQGQQQQDKIRMMMNMLMMMRQMKQQQGQFQQEFGLKQGQEQRLQEQALRAQEQWDLQRKEYEEKQQYFAEHPELKGLLYAGINPYAEERAQRRMQLDEEKFTLTKQHTAKQLELLDLNIEDAQKRLKGMPTEFVNLFMTQALQEKQGMEAQLQQQLINMGTSIKSLRLRLLNRNLLIHLMLSPNKILMWVKIMPMY